MTNQSVPQRPRWRLFVAGSILQGAVAATAPVWGVLVWGYPGVARGFVQRYTSSSLWDIVTLSAGASLMLLLWLGQCYWNLPRTHGIAVSGSVVAALLVVAQLCVVNMAHAVRGPASSLMWWIVAAIWLFMVVTLLGLLLASWKLAGPPWEAFQISEAANREERQARVEARLAKQRARKGLE